MTFEVGKTYRVLHSRRGQFSLQVTAVSDEWITGNVVEGHAEKINGGCHEPENLTSRAEFLTILEEIQQ